MLAITALFGCGTSRFGQVTHGQNVAFEIALRFERKQFMIGHGGIAFSNRYSVGIGVDEIKELYERKDIAYISFDYKNLQSFDGTVTMSENRKRVSIQLKSAVRQNGESIDVQLLNGDYALAETLP